MEESRHDFDNLVLKPVADIHTDFDEKFGIPRQPGLAKHLKGRIVFRKEYRKPGILKDIEQFSHLWLIWGFSENTSIEWTPTVRPPRLGGNQRVGVFACRSPFRPNPIGMSAVKLLGIDHDSEDGEVLIVSGSDLMDGTPIYDIKPYIPYCDRIDEASEGFAEQKTMKHLDVVIQDCVREKIPEDKIEGLREVLSQDPRPQYQHDPDRVYGFEFAGMNVRFRVQNEDTVIVTDIL